MTNAGALAHGRWPAGMMGFGRLLCELGLGFAYWVAFDLALEPGHLAALARAGVAIAWDQEVTRIVGAGILGGLATPPVLALVRRFPIEGRDWRRRAALHLGATIAIAVLAVAASCVAADWLLTSERRPLPVALREELIGVAPLLAFCFAGLDAAAHAARFSRAQRTAAPTLGARPLTRVPVKARAGLVMVALADVDWIESQGNYLALHVGAQTHLIRATSKRFEAGLDPARFLRVHRRTIVALERVSALAPLGGGDATVRLDTGAELRVSRAYREPLAARLRGR